MRVARERVPDTHRGGNRLGDRAAYRGESLLVGHVEVAKVTHTLPDGRVLLDEVSFRVADGAKVALVGANGAGKTTLMRLVAGDLDAAGGRGRPLRRARRHAPVHRPGARRVDRARPARVGRAARACAAAAAELDAAELRDDGGRRRAHADGLRARDRRLGRRRRLRRRGALGRLHRRRARHPVREGAVPRDAHAVRRRAEAAGARGAAARARRGAAARRARQLPRRARQGVARAAARASRRRPCCSSPTTASCSRARRPRSSPSSSAPPATPRGRTAAASRPTTRRAPTASRASRSCAAAGTRSTQKLKELVQMYKVKAKYNDGMASRYQAAKTRLREVRGGRAAAGDRRASRPSRCGSSAGARASAR